MQIPREVSRRRVLRALALGGASTAALKLSPVSAWAEEDISESLIDAMTALFGSHPGFRTNHAKGIVCRGSFLPAKAAASLSRAAHLQGSPVPITVRFSDFGGVPTVPDGDPGASPRGMAIRFHLPNGGETDIIGHSYNGFPVGTPQDMLAFLRALAASGPNTVKPTPIEIFLEGHPQAKRFATASQPPPASFTTESYYGVNAFRFINREGRSRNGRYRIHPVDGDRHLASAEASNRPVNYLRDELPKRLARGPARFRLMVQLAGDGDPISDGSLPWPEDRPKVELGMVTLSVHVPESDAAERALAFSPINLVAGIEPSDDPMISARAASYPISVTRRNR